MLALRQLHVIHLLPTHPCQWYPHNADVKMAHSLKSSNQIHAAGNEDSAMAGDHSCDPLNFKPRRPVPLSMMGVDSCLRPL